MPLIQEHPLDQLFRPEPLLKSIDRLTVRVGEEITEEVTERTPVAELPPGVTPQMRGRAPGTLKESWETGLLERRRTATGVEGRAIESFTEDEIAPHVEWPTRPHVIRPRLNRPAMGVTATGKPRRMGGDPQAALRYVNRFGRVVYASEVYHPGTQGSHMMRDALAEVDATWANTIGREEVERWAREQAELVR